MQYQEVYANMEFDYLVSMDEYCCLPRALFSKALIFTNPD